MAHNHSSAGSGNAATAEPACFELFRTKCVAYQVAYTRSEVINLLTASGVAARAALRALTDEELLDRVVQIANNHDSPDACAVRDTLASDSDDSHDIVEAGDWSANLLADNEVAAHR